MLLALPGCSGDDLSGPNRFYSVLFTMSTTGNVTVQVVSYLDTDGNTIQVTNPGANWSVTISLRAGQTALVQASGTVNTAGSVTVALDANDMVGVRVTKSDVCTIAAGPQSCSVIADTVLPR